MSKARNNADASADIETLEVDVASRAPASANLSTLTNDLTEVTNTPPASAAGKPNGFIWFIV